MKRAANLRGGLVRRQLVAASCSLLGAKGTTAGALDVMNRVLDGVTVDSALAYYREDGRIQAIEPVVDVNKTFANGQSASLNFTFDSLSGTSPNGALPSTQPQTFASPSGKSLTAGRHLYTTRPGDLPGDPNYEDNRIAVSAGWNVPLARGTLVGLGGKISGEDDFVSVSLNASIAQDFNEKNTTVSVAVNNEFDAIRPIGGTPVAGSDYALFEKTANKSKDGIGVLLGVTQVMARWWLTEINLSADRFHGYLNDPYKITSVIDAVGNTLGYAYESRPDERTRKSIYWENRMAWQRLGAGLSLRYMRDDWRIHSDTAQLHVRWTFADREQYVEPTFRWYRQSAAYFYMPWISGVTQGAPEYSSSDSRLGEFHALTYGLKYARRWSDAPGLAGSEFSVRLEYYQQTQESREATPLLLQNLDLHPALKAVLLQFGWRF